MEEEFRPNNKENFHNKRPQVFSVKRNSKHNYENLDTKILHIMKIKAQNSQHHYNRKLTHSWEIVNMNYIIF